MATVCKTREAAQSGKRDKPHYFLFAKDTRYFTIITRGAKNPPWYSVPASLYVKLGTWGPSR